MSKLSYTGFSRAKFEEIVLRHYRNAYVTRRLYTEYQDDRVKPINLTLYYSTDKTIDEKLKFLCSTWYSEDHPVYEGVADDGVYEQPNGCITYAGGIKEITEATFHDLSPFLGLAK